MVVETVKSKEVEFVLYVEEITNNHSIYFFVQSAEESWPSTKNNNNNKKPGNNEHDWALLKYVNILHHNRTQKQLWY